MWVSTNRFNVGKGNTIQFIDIVDARKSIAIMLNSAEMPPSLKHSVKIEQIIEDLTSLDFMYTEFFLEWGRAFGVSVQLTLRFKRNDEIEGENGDKICLYTFETEIGAVGTRYTLAQAMALNTLQARVIEFASALECMFQHPVGKVVKKRS